MAKPTVTNPTTKGSEFKRVVIFADYNKEGLKMEWELIEEYFVDKDVMYLACSDNTEVHTIKGSVLIAQNEKNKERLAQGWGGLYYTHIMELPKPPKAI